MTPTAFILLCSLAIAGCEYMSDIHRSLYHVNKPRCLNFCIYDYVETDVQSQILSNEGETIERIENMFEEAEEFEGRLKRLIDIIRRLAVDVHKPVQRRKIEVRAQDFQRLRTTLKDRTIKCQWELHYFMIKTATGYITNGTQAHEIVTQIETNVDKMLDLKESGLKLIPKTYRLLKSVARNAVDLLETLFHSHFLPTD